MDWASLLCADRFGADRPGAPDPARSPYQIDADRIVFSSAFRRLQDKTHVFPLADNDYVRTRLTHSLEVASVARSLGARVGAVICQRHKLGDSFHASDFGAIVHAAALAHDLGNPPFGHSGEDAIRHWFCTSSLTESLRTHELTPAERADFEHFEGNAQGFRVVVRLQMPDNPGLRLTCATLGAFTKYPRESRLALDPKNRPASAKKYGFFQSERDAFAQLATKLNLARRNESWWARHPLAFLVEAADDICYRLVDFEDGYRLKHLEFDEVRDRFLDVIGDPKDRERSERLSEPKEQIAFLRAKGIGAAVEQTASLFLDLEEKLLAGTWDAPLLDHIPAGAALEQIRERSVTTIYRTSRGVEIEAAGYEVLGGLLEVFFGAADEVARSTKPSHRAKRLLELVPEQFLGANRIPSQSPYCRLQRLTDFVAGMTDSYAVSLYKRVRGISLPGR